LPAIFEMHHNKISILSTRPLPAAIIHTAGEKNIELENSSFIETTRIENDQLIQRILHLSHHRLNIVFTSTKGVEAVLRCIPDRKPDWNIFCLGSTTNKLVKKAFGKDSVGGTAGSARELADVIINQRNITSVIFFCGDKSREELPRKLIAHQVEVNAIEVYRTQATPRQITSSYDGILFYSPSAVSSFFSVNTIGEKTILFAIGNTTAEEIKKYTFNKIIVGREPVKELLAQEAVNYFDTIIHH